MSTKKQEALDLIQTMPDSSTTLDVVESLIVKEQIEKGLADVEAGRVISNDELQSRLSQWRKSNGR